MTLDMYIFNGTIPAPNNNPSDDQPGMLVNNDQELLIWDVDHFGYNVNSSGYHQQIRMPNYTNYSPPIGAALPAVIANFGGLFCNTTVAPHASSETGLWY